MTKNYIFGIHPVIEAIKAGKNIDKVFIQKSIQAENINELRTLLKENFISTKVVPIEKLNRITRKNHQGVICFMSPIPLQKIEDIVPSIYENGESPFILVLDGVSDVGNFGAICRTAECAGVHAILIPEKGSAQISPDTVKTSTGSIFNINVCRTKSLSNSIKYLQDSGIKTVSCTEKCETNYTEIDYNTPIAIIMGAEGTGISENIIHISDESAKIPLVGSTGSLNVSVATGIILYEALRQRN